MSWANDMGIDGMEPPEHTASFHGTVWTDWDGGDTDISDLTSDHLRNIIRGLEANKSYWDQHWKLPFLREELARRETSTNNKPTPSAGTNDVK